MQLFRVPLRLPLLVFTCWAFLGGINGTCTTDDDCSNSGKCVSDVCDCTGTGYEGDTCADDVNECTDGTDNCHDDAKCENTDGSFTCTCNDDFVGDGVTCERTVCTADGDECLNGGTCNIPTDGAAGTCTCQDGYDGPTCADDVNECDDGTDNCHDDAECTNTIGSFTCTCNDGFVGDGVTCQRSGAAKISVPIMLIPAVAVLTQLSFN